MARPTRKLSTEQKIENIVAQIKEAEANILSVEQNLISLKKQKSVLEDDLRTEKINLLLEAMDAKNISIDKAKEIIDNMEHE